MIGSISTEWWAAELDLDTGWTSENKLVEETLNDALEELRDQYSPAFGHPVAYLFYQSFVEFKDEITEIIFNPPPDFYEPGDPDAIY